MNRTNNIVYLRKPDAGRIEHRMASGTDMVSKNN